MADVRDETYRTALRDFSNYLQWLHRAAGEPPYREVSRYCKVSTATVHRYLHGTILPRWQFCEAYLARYERVISFYLGSEAATDLKTRWMAARDVLHPLTPPIPVAPQATRRLTAVTSETPSRRIA